MKSCPAILIWSLAFCCSVVLVLFAYNMYPVPDGDAINPIPTIKAYATSGILQNKLFLVPSTIDPSGLGRYLAYPPGMPLFFGSLMSFFGDKSYQSALIVLSLARCASAFIFAKVLIIALKRRAQPASLRLILISLTLVASNSFFLFASNGRSEILSILIVSFSLWAALTIKPYFKRHIFFQICVGLLFPVSIANGLIGACLYCLYLVYDIRVMRKRFLLFTLMFIFSVVLFALSYFLIGIPLQDGLSGIMLHASAAVTGYSIDLSFGQSLSYYKSWIIFGILALVQFTLYSISFWRDKSNQWADKLILILSISVLIIFAYYFGGRFASQHYNLYAFLPIYQLLAFQLVVAIPDNKSRLPRILWAPLITLAAVLSLLQPLQAILLFPYYLTSGSTYSNMKNRFEKIDTGTCHVVYTIGIAWLDEKQSGSVYARDDLSGVVPTERMKSDSKKASCVVAFVQEVNSNSPTPEGMQLIADFSDRSNYTRLLRSLRLLNSPKGYSFKAYTGAVNMDVR